MNVVIRYVVRYVVAVVGGVVLGYAFTEVIPLLLLGEGAIETDLGTAGVLALAAFFPALFVGWFILRRWSPAVVVAVIGSLSAPVVYMFDLIERPMGQPLIWPTFLVPIVAAVVAVAFDLAELRRDAT